MDTLKAFAMGKASRHKELMIFDWKKAARIIKERKAKNASAGLSGDWEWTGGDILQDGEPLSKEETYCFLASTWAIPELEVDGDLMECYCMQSETPGWNYGTFWPEEALAILRS